MTTKNTYFLWSGSMVDPTIYTHFNSDNFSKIFRENIHMISWDKNIAKLR